jgi:membrane fusion protein (multidrug efflux system)
MTKKFLIALLLAVAPAAQAQAPAQGTIQKPAPAPQGNATEPKPAAKAAAPADAEVAALILAGEETTLSSQMGGRIRSVSVGLGDGVKKGTRLIEFDCSEQQSQLDAAAAEYRAARETHLARLRLQALGAAGELEVTVAAASADKAKSQVTLRESQMAYCRVDAPFSGNVARMRVKASESVNPNQPLVDLVNPASLKAQMFVPAAWIAWLRSGAQVKLLVRETGEIVQARISKINARVDGVSQQLEVEARIDRTTRLLPGMVATATFPGRK